MQQAAVVGAKVVIAIILAVSLAGQVFVVPFMADEMVRMYPEFEGLRIPGIVGCIALVVCAQVALLCVWRLLSMVAGASIFSITAFRWVKVLIGCCAAFTGLIAAAFIVLYAANAMQGGVMVMLLAAFIGGIGATLLLVVMKGLLRKASQLEQDMAEVV
ncbi:DUF2975 domain-containing protein [Compostimonas suwonensis]|uniref:DUF2975 family protein n=1 Tax=Compostimonas suwonensis TaxID=1048394 RepID=A0A2M9C022_9MICO|nr:DUF2975 domain-containing protein [Compostimonas suwonensis]PJJ63687.1 Protein of unknown function (DUF2975) [Compostimonas suwonensis]